MKKKVEPTWVKTRTPLMWKHTPSGGFYARVKVAGKDNWKSLDTDILSVAKNRLDKRVRAIRGSHEPIRGPTVGEALETAARDEKDDPDTAENTGLDYEALVPTIPGTFPDPDQRLDKVCAGDMEDWKRAHSRNYAASRTNGALVLWRLVLARAIKAGHVAEERHDRTLGSLGSTPGRRRVPPDSPLRGSAGTPGGPGSVAS